MGDEYREVEQVDAEVVEEGKKAFTMPEEPVAPETPKPNFSESDSAGYSYEQTVNAVNSSKTFGIISVVSGVLCLVCCCACGLSLVLGILAVVMGIISLNKEPEAKTLAIIGIVCGAIGGVLGVIGVVLGGIFSATKDVIDGSFDFSDEILNGLENIGDL